MRITLNICLFLLPILCFSQEKMTHLQYVEKYKELAIKEMHRTGVPASITLAQGILESGSGNSELALKAKNHFGVKGHRDWNGDCFIMDDDEKDECFRVYKTVEESYIDHSDFLTGNQRYAFLFELRTTDYKGWAHGLKKAGYATNPKYANILIGLIERYNLQEYDNQKKKTLLAKKTQKAAVFEINGIPAIAYNGDMTIREIRDNYFFAEWQIFKYNDFKRGQKLKQGMVLYLKPKKRKNDVYKQHKVTKGETMHFIAQLRGVKLKRLYKLNNLTEGEEPIPGSIINLSKKRETRPKTLGTDDKPEFAYFTIDEENQLYQNKKYESGEENLPIADQHVVETEDGIYHQVGPGETLMAIARAYDVDWKTLKENNQLETNELKEGQLLLIREKEKIANNPIQETAEATITNPSTYKPTGTTKKYIVKEGDTMFKVARLHVMTVAELMKLNNLKEPILKKGDEIEVYNN